MTRHDLRIDVSEAVGLPDVAVAATVIAPTTVAEHPVVAVAFPGGGYARGYWDIGWPGGYSQAEHHVGGGWVFAAIDHLGVGTSSLPDPSVLTFELMAAANAAATRTIISRLPVTDPFVIGIGQSMGGCLSIVAQAIHQPFDALAVLGFSASHTVLPSPQGAVTVSAVARGRTDEAGFVNEAEEVGGLDVFGWAFHFDDVDAAIRREDLRGGFPFRTEHVPPWGSATVPPAAASMLTAGVVAEEAAAITVPVFVGFGERDVCPDPWAEPASYRGSRHVTLRVVEQMAHMHNFATSRREMWDSVHRWGEALR